MCFALSPLYRRLGAIASYVRGNATLTTASSGDNSTLVLSAYPSVSIIMPATRPVEADQALQALSEQRYAGTIETIVVGVLADELAQRWPIRAVNVGAIREPGRARNIGAAHAIGEVLIFVDDDILVEHDWIERNIAVLKQPGIGLVGARMPGKSSAFFARCVDFTNYGYYQSKRSMDRSLSAASMAIPSLLFRRCGGFDESLCSSEDIELCHRIQQLNYRTTYQSQISVIHNHQRDTLYKLLCYNYTHGVAGSLLTKIRHRHCTFKNRLLYSVRFPPVFLLLLPFIACSAALQIVVLNVKDDKRVLLYAPFILLGKLAYQSGVFTSLLKEALFML